MTRSRLAVELWRVSTSASLCCLSRGQISQIDEWACDSRAMTSGRRSFCWLEAHSPTSSTERTWLIGSPQNATVQSKGMLFACGCSLSQWTGIGSWSLSLQNRCLIFLMTILSQSVKRIDHTAYIIQYEECVGKALNIHNKFNLCTSFWRSANLQTVNAKHRVLAILRASQVRIPLHARCKLAPRKTASNLDFHKSLCLRR